MDPNCTRAQFKRMSMFGECLNERPDDWANGLNDGPKPAPIRWPLFSPFTRPQFQQITDAAHQASVWSAENADACDCAVATNIELEEGVTLFYVSVAA